MKIAGYLLGIIFLLGASSVQEASAGCRFWTKLVGGMRAEVEYEAAHHAIVHLQASIRTLEELNAKDKIWGSSNYTLAQLVNPLRSVPLSTAHEQKVEWKAALNALQTILRSTETLTGRLNEPSQRLVRGQALALLQRVMTNIIYGNSFFYATRFFQRFRDGPSLVTDNWKDIMTSIETIEPKAFDANLVRLVRNLVELAQDLPPDLETAAKEYLSSKSVARVARSSTIHPGDADWREFEIGYVGTRTSLHQLPEISLNLPALESGVASPVDTPTKSDKPASLIDPDLAKDLGVEAEAPSSIGESGKSRNGLVTRSEEARDRSEALKLATMPRAQRAEYEARRNSDRKLRTALNRAKGGGSSNGQSGSSGAQ